MFIAGAVLTFIVFMGLMKFIARINPDFFKQKFKKWRSNGKDNDESRV